MVHGAHGLAAGDAAADRAKTMPSIADVAHRRFGQSVAAKLDKVMPDATLRGTSGYRTLGYRTLAAKGPAAAAGVVAAAVTFRREHPRGSRW
jgi:hypothetical protein